MTPEVTMHEVTLAGCAPTPLAHYLKALGVLRLVAEAEQADPDVRGFWRDDTFVLRGRLDRDGLARFFLDTYRPTPILAPWNGGSGFFPKDNRKAFQAIAAATTPRFAGYAAALARAAAVLAAHGLGESPKDEAKQALLRDLRGELADDALDWLDAAVLLTAKGREFPPLLGTGGNDGRLDFTNNFMQRLLDLIAPADGAATRLSAGWLDAALFGDATPALVTAAIGQFAPGAAGGANASTGFSADSLTNPWDFVLMLEGCLPFAAAATRRLEHAGPAGIGYPFTVLPTGGGFGGIALGDEAPARAEMWLPLWSRPAGYDELRALLAEGRATLGRRPARDGLDFARAVARLGVDRGLDAFQRVAFQMRSGKAYLATPLGRMAVRRNPNVDLIDDIDGWLAVFRKAARRDTAPARLTGVARRLDDALFDLTRDGGTASVQAVLVAFGAAMRVVARSPEARAEIRPPRQLDPRWVTAADDRSDAFRLAAALAGLDLRPNLGPVSDDGKTWLDSLPRAVWGEGELVPNLLAVLRRRLVDAGRTAAADKPLAGRLPADLAAVAAFLAGPALDARIAALLAGLAWVEMPRSLPPRGEEALVAPACAALKLLFTTNGRLRRLKLLPENGVLPIPDALVARLATGDVGEALRLAIRRLQAVGLAPAFPLTPPPGVTGARLAAALLVPVDMAATRRLAYGLLPDFAPAPDPATATATATHEDR